MRVACFGTVAFDTIVDVADLPRRGETIQARSLLQAPGGCAGNVAARLAALGVRPALVGAVGPDFAGSAYEARLKELGVEASRLVASEKPTAHALILSDRRTGSQTSVWHDGATPDLKRLKPFPCTYAVFSPGDFRAYPRFMERCWRILFDPGQETFHHDLREIMRCVRHADYLFVNETEHTHLRREAGLDERVLFAGGMRAIIVTRGAKGSELRTAKARVRVPAFRAKVRDPSGAGDAHRAGFLYGLLTGCDAATALRVANCLASFAVEAEGAQGGLATPLDLWRRYTKPR